MFLKNELEKKLNTSSKEYGLILNQDNKITVKPKTKSKIKLDPFKSYPRGLRLFSNDDISNAAKLAKEYLRQVKDPDILELNQKPWNASTQQFINYRPELKKTLFEVRHGLKDVNMVKLKPKHIELGCDSRDVAYFGWNGSSLVDKLEKKSIFYKEKEEGLINSISYWNENENILNYKSPFEKNKEMNNIMRELKIKNNEERENLKIKVKYENPKSSPEKIAALTYKEMFLKLNYELNRKLNKDLEFYHDSEEISKKLKLPYHKEIIEKKKRKIESNIENEREKRINQIKEKRYYIKHLEIFENKNKIKDNDNVNKTRLNDEYKLSVSNSNINASNNINTTLNNVFKTQIKQSNNKNKWILKDYFHPGLYCNIPSQLIEKDKELEIVKKNSLNEEFQAWSCCLNTNKDSKGCVSNVVNKIKWYYES